MPLTPPFSAVRRPTVDEWGVYDPQQAGLAALHARLIDTPTPAPQEPPTEVSRARVPQERPARRSPKR